MGKLLTIDDVRNRHKCGRDGAYEIIRKAGGKKMAGKWKIREERLDEWELGPRGKSKRPAPEMLEDFAAELLAE